MIFLAKFQKNNKVAVLGASGGIGQPLALLLKHSPLINHLALFDIVNTPGWIFKYILSSFLIVFHHSIMAHSHIDSRFTLH